MSGPLTFQKTTGSRKKQADWWFTGILVILIAITIMGILTAKKYLEVGRPIDPNEMVIKQLNEVIENSPDTNPDALAALAYQYQKNEDYDSAREQYNEVLKVNPNHVGALYNMGVIAQKTQDLKGSEEWFKKLLAKRPSHVLGTLALGNLYLEQKKPDEAIKVVDGIMKYSAAVDKIELYQLRGKAYELKGNKAKAIENYRIVLKYVPGNKEATEALEKLK